VERHHKVIKLKILFGDGFSVRAEWYCEDLPCLNSNYKIFILSGEYHAGDLSFDFFILNFLFDANVGVFEVTLVLSVD
jgi:hypothetical protein